MALHSNEPIQQLLEQHIAAGDFPSAVYLAAEKGKAVFGGALGNAVVEPETHPATPDTLYDLASLTKPLVTGLLYALFQQRGLLRLDAKVSHYLPEFARAEDKRDITLLQLLTHISGLPAWLPLNRLAADRAAVLSVIAAQPLAESPGAQVIYSDLGFIVLGFILEKIHRARLDSIAYREIFAPLKLTRTMFNPPAVWRQRIAASETGNRHEINITDEMELPDAKPDFAARTETIWGAAHDGNAYFMEGVAGHAGLFSTAGETLRIAEQFHARRSGLLTPDTCKLFRRDYTEDLSEARSIGWQLAATENSTAGERLSLDSFGHLGFTGTSLWNDPERERIYILLTNRTHGKETPFVNINHVRREFNYLAAIELDKL